MPEKEVVEQAKEDLKEGKSPSTAAGEFVREEIEHVREGKHGARSDSAKRAARGFPWLRRKPARPANPREKMRRGIPAKDSPLPKRRRRRNGRAQANRP
jgi:hypothetical protein